MYLMSIIMLIFMIGITLIFPVLYYFRKKKMYLYSFFTFWSFVVLLFLILSVAEFINSKATVVKDDLYGNYVIDKEMFKGKNATWQYQHFSFLITKDDVFIFYKYSDSGKIKSVYKREVEFVNYASPHLRILNVKPNNQVIESEPLLVRKKWGFFYVFKSHKFGNMFFTKEEKGIFRTLFN